MGMRYALVWSEGGRERRAVISFGERFLGRVPREDAEALGVSVNPFAVYIYSTDGGEVVNTGIESLVVGRRHAKLVARPGGVGVHPTLDIIDHGMRGTGSRNGTYVNGERIRPGEAVRLQVGDKVRLASIGPIFIVAAHSEGETVIRAVADLPEELPRETADKLERIGLIAERRDVDDMAVVVISRSAEVDLGGGVRVESVDIGSEVAKRMRFMWRIGRVAQLAIDNLLEDRCSEAVKEIEKLDLEVVRRFIKGLGDEKLFKTYADIVALARLGGEGVGKDSLLRLLRRFVDYLDVHFITS